jgi:hypothetical protein
VGRRAGNSSSHWADIAPKRCFLAVQESRKCLNVEITGRDLRERMPPAGQNSLFQTGGACGAELSRDWCRLVHLTSVGVSGSHALFDLARHVIVFHDVAAVPQATRLSLDHEHPERMAGLQYQDTSCLLR